MNLRNKLDKAIVDGDDDVDCLVDNSCTLMARVVNFILKI